jgi:hypothetical protein
MSSIWWSCSPPECRFSAGVFVAKSGLPPIIRNIIRPPVRANRRTSTTATAKKTTLSTVVYVQAGMRLDDLHRAADRRQVKRPEDDLDIAVVPLLRSRKTWVTSWSLAPPGA